MPDIQCRHGGNCRQIGSGCRFVHPSDPQWANSQPAKRWNDRDHRDPPPRRSSGSEWVTSTNSIPVREGGRQRGASGGSSSSKDGYAWNFDSKGTSSSFSASVENSWGNKGSSKTDAAPEQSGNSGWGNVTGGWGCGGWGDAGGTDASKSIGGNWDNLDDNTETSSGASGWGVNESKSSGGAWGASDNNNHAGKSSAQPTSSSGWGPVSPISTTPKWGINEGKSSGGGWGASDNDNLSGKPSVQPASSSGWGNVSPKSTIPRHTDTLKSAESTSPRLSSDWSKINIGSGGPGTSQVKSSGSWSGWDTGPSETTVKEPFKDVQSKAKAKATDRDVQMRDPSPVLMPPPPLPTQAASTLPTTTRQLPPPLRLDSNFDDNVSNLHSPLYAPPSSVSPAIPPKLPSRLANPPPTSLSNIAKTMAAERSVSPSKPPGPKRKRTRGELYQSTLRHMQNAVILHVEYQRAQEDDERWKRTQNSSIYGHATQATRKILQTQRAEYSLRLSTVKDELKKEIQILSRLPDFTTPRSTAVSLLTKETVAAYTGELKAWFEDLELHKRLMLEEETVLDKPNEVDKPLNENSDGGPVDETTPQPDIPAEDDLDIGLKPSDLAKREKWTWKDLLEATATVEKELSDAEAALFFKAYTDIPDDRDNKLADLTTQLAIDDEVQELDVQTKDIKEVSKAVQGAGEKLSVQAKELGALLARADELQKEIDKTTAERKYFESVNAQAEKYCADFERWEAEDQARIASLTEQIQNLHLLKKRKPVPPPEVAQSLPPHLDITTLLDYILPRIIDRFKPELEVALSNHRSRCIENQRQLKDDLFERSDVITRQVEVVRELVRQVKMLDLPNANNVGRNLLNPPPASAPAH